MKTSLRVAGAALLISALIIPAVALAAEIRVGASPMVPASETVNNDVYLFGGNITSIGKVNGDLVSGGGSIVVSGSVAQDLLIGGGSITALADVGDDVRIGGGNILISGKVGNDVVVGGGETRIAGIGVGGDVLWGGGALQVDAPVGGNMQLAGNEAVINSHVRGNVQFKGTKLTLGKDAVIDGNLDYTAQSEATMEAGAVVKGKTTYEPQKPSPATAPLSATSIFAIVSLLVLGKFLAMLLLALLLGLIFRRFTQTLIERAAENPLLETGRGLIVFIVLPVASVMALVTLIGIPVGILGLITFAALMLVSSSFAAVVAGSLVHKWAFKTAQYQVAWQTILIGVAIYTLLGFIPFIGGLAKFLLLLLALGSAVKIKWEVAKEWR